MTSHKERSVAYADDVAEVGGVVIESVGELSSLANGTPFFEAAEFTWSQLKPAPGPLGSYEWSERMVGPIVRVRVVLREGHVVVDEVRVTRFRDDDAEVSPTTLGKIPLRKIVDAGTEQLLGLAYGAAVNRNPSDWGSIEGLRSARESVGAARRKRRVVTDELLRETARVYLADVSGKPTRAVADHFPTSHRNATRYVKLARDAGYLPEYGKEEE